MRTRSISEFHEPVLLIDPRTDDAVELAAQLELSGFATCIESNVAGALAAIERASFATLIVVADVEDPARLRWLGQLRRSAARSWILVVTPQCDTETRNLVYRHGGDACIAAPLSFNELTSCLTAFRSRARPVF
jgi:DNA-binding response OmpR family regulator